jgi:hypothetical protein
VSEKRAPLTLHRVARLPLELGRVATELVVRPKDERELSCLSSSARRAPEVKGVVRTTMHAAEPVPGCDVGEVAGKEITVGRQSVRAAGTARPISTCC